MYTRSRFWRAAIAALGASLLVGVAPGTAGAAPTTDPPRGLYSIGGADTPAERTAIAATGVDIGGAAGERLDVVATPKQAAQLRSAGFDVRLTDDFDALLSERSGRAAAQQGRAGTTTEAAPAAIADFPAGDEGYHTFAEVTSELQQAVRDHGAITSLSSAGNSFEGRALHLIKISDNVRSDEAEPEVLFTCGQHAREHLTVEMCLRIVSRLTDGYATNAAIRSFVDSREIWVVPSVNPDGAEYDISNGQYRGWRKNRQNQGTDPNRNWGYRWGCCGGSSTNPSSDTYRGTAAFSAPETRAVANFVNSRSMGGVQQIKSHLDFHTYSELVLWPYGYTYSDTATGMSSTEAQRFRTVGREIAASNGYTAQQASDLYITDGSINDWMWGQHKILSFTLEMYPRTSNGLSGFYPPDEVIGRETARNDTAIDIILREAR